MPESFKVLIKELQSIGLDIKVLNEDEEEIPMHDSDDDINETARDLDLNIDGEIPTSNTVETDEYTVDENSTEDAEFDLVADIGNFNMEAKDELDGDANNSDDIE